MNTPPSTTGASDRFAPGTLGEHLEQAEARFQARKINKHQKGDILEKAFLRIGRLDAALDLREIMTFPEWALSANNPGTKEAPGPLPRDRGIDLVAIRRDGSRIAIQCKFHEKPISSGDVKSFLAEMNPGKGNPEIFAQGWLVSTTDPTSGLDHDLKTKHRNIQARSIWEWGKTPMDSGALFPKQELRPHQERAVEAISKRLPKERRGKLVMACGTGKTLTALRATERLVQPGEIALVCVPTIVLASQFRDEWLRHAERPLDSLVVCSDSGAGRPGSRQEAESSVAARELSAPVSTDPRRIREFLERPAPAGQRKVVFSTYRSLDKVAEAIGGSRTSGFKLAIADEAHKTTGTTNPDLELDAGERQTRKTAIRFHDDAQIPARMRLYMTATPRIYGNRKSLAKRGLAVIDMDDEGTFGHELFRYDFAQAVKDEVLCDYRVIALGVSEDSLTPILEEAVRGSGLKDTTPSDMTRVLGTLVALRGGASSSEQGSTGVLHRTIAFANSIARSKWFVKQINDANVKRRATELAQAAGGLTIEGEHLDASAPMAKRRAKLKDLAEARRSNAIRVLSNVGLFSEGVDVPSLNAVAFLDARKSPIEIVQAVGRVMRRPERSGDKSLGYVVVPTALPSGKDFEAAIRDAEERFQPLLSVIQALQSHDGDLAGLLETKLIVRSDLGAKDNENAPREPEVRERIQLEMDLRAKRALLPFVVGKTGLTHDRRKADTADSIEFRVKREAAKMVVLMGPALARIFHEGHRDRLQTVPEASRWPRGASAA